MVPLVEKWKIEMVDLSPPDLDDTALRFGKHKGLTPNEIAENDPGYIVWMYENLDNAPCSEALYDECYTENEFHKDFYRIWCD